MSSILVINALGPETRVALVENGTISEFYLERKKDKGIVGNIYKGKVVRVLPGMQAAFVDIGLEKAAFLYVADVAGGPDFSEEFDIAETPEGEHGEPPAGDVPSDDVNDSVEAEPAPAAPALPESNEPSGTEPAPEGVVEAAPEAIPSVEAAPAAEGSPTPEAPVAEIAPVAEQTPAPVAAPAKTKAPRVEERPTEPLARKRRKEGQRPAEHVKAGRTAQIQDLLKEGQEVIVQVVKDPIGSKGARVTCHISLPGRHLVFMPTVDHVGISRRVENEKERRRLRELVDALRPPGTGFIVRTVAEGVEKDKLVADIKFLLGIWNDIARKKDKLRAPALLHPDLDLILRSIRDLFSAEIEKLVIDDRGEFERIREFVQGNTPSLASAIEFYDGKEPIFDAYGIEAEITRATQRKVWLKSGGYLIIDQAEALTAIDVNSGRFVGKKNLEETITAINTEASKEIVYQLRLRNIGGIIIIDFIDMERAQNRDKVLKSLQDALQKDRAKTNIVKISELGLVEMTRKRTRESVTRLLHEPCAHCDGRGHIKSRQTIAYDIFREVQREAMARREDTLVVTCSMEVAAYVAQEERETLRHFMMRYNRTITIKGSPTTGYESFDVQSRWAKNERPEKTKEDRPERPKPEPSAQLALPVQQTKAPVEGDDDDEGEDGDDDETPGATPAAGQVATGTPGQPGAPGAPSGKRRRRRRRRGGGGGQPGAPGGAPGGAPAPAGNSRPPSGS